MSFKCPNNSTTLKTKYYLGGYEKEIDDAENVKEVHYIPGGDGLLALYIVENETGTLYYVHKDHLGSLYALTDEIGETGANVYVGSNKNFKKYGLKNRNVSGDIRALEGERANGITISGNAYGSFSDDKGNYAKFTNNKIFLSKNTIRGIWESDKNSVNTLYHEWFHARDYYTGIASYYNAKYFNDIDRYKQHMEFRAYFYIYQNRR